MTGCSVFGETDVEKPDYSVVLKDYAFEIREYPALVMVSTESQGDYDETSNASFNRLFDYISGENIGSSKVEMTAPVMMEETSQKIEMTAPVLMSEKDKNWKMSFLLPSEYTFETAPKPTNEKVYLEKTAPKKVAVLTFSGLLRKKKINDMRKELEKWMDEKGYEYDAEDYKAAGYNPPWTIPALRRNEIIIPIKE